jgi:hypothetical protein
MRREPDDKPTVDETGKGLGVRTVPVNGITDVDLDDERRVVLNGKGMSVAPGWRDLPFFLIPKRLVDKVPAARGSSTLYCFAMGDGGFQNGQISEDLALRLDSATHGVVVPQSLVSVDRYQMALAATRDDWSVDET